MSASEGWGFRSSLVSVEPFSETGGQRVERIAIEGSGLAAHVLTFGAIVQELRLEGHPEPLVLGYGRLGDYLSSANFMGSIVGRYANRIGGARFTLDGERYELDANCGGVDTLHGGSSGYGRLNWTLAEAGADFVTLSLSDTSGHMGFPGSVEVSCTYRLKPSHTLEVTLEARPDRATPLAMAHHAYFNLDNGGHSDALDHRVMIPAAAYLPVDERDIPTGAVQPVDDTEFDFRLGREIRHQTEGQQFAYDHNFCIASDQARLRLHAWVQAPSGLEMEVWSNEPGLQFYAGGKLGGNEIGLTGEPYQPFAGFCLEPQAWPDSVNRPYFPNTIVRAGEVHRQVTEYRFRLR